MQRLFSTFANGWPGFGLLVQRLITAIILLDAGVAQWKNPVAGLTIPEISGAFLGLFLLVGFWTPVTGALIAAVEIWIIFAGDGDIWRSLVLAVLAATLAMIGPGAWSVDARLFGRKHIRS